MLIRQLLTVCSQKAHWSSQQAPLYSVVTLKSAGWGPLFAIWEATSMEGHLCVRVLHILQFF